MTSAIGEHFFRHEYGRLVALLSRRIGVYHLEAVEDAVQFALLSAVESWPKGVVPENPSAWLFRVAYNRVIGELRRRARGDALAERYGRGDIGMAEDAPITFFPGEICDDLLRMLFACCDDAIPIESQLVLALKTLCGFDVAEISERLFITGSNVYKRLARARSRLREVRCEPADLTSDQFTSRLPAVQSILYLLFTEGYLSSHPERAIRHELCDEAIRLTEILTQHSMSAPPDTFALLALMHLHNARIEARLDGSGGFLLLGEQDRSRWKRVDEVTRPRGMYFRC